MATITERAVSMALAVSFGNALCSLVVFVPALSYPASSQAPIMFMISTIMLSESKHVGINLTSSALTVLGGCIGSVLAGVVTLATQTDVGTFCLCAFVVFPLLYLLRFGAHPKYVRKDIYKLFLLCFCCHSL